jgi:phosphopantothenoylcysteine decarboxylase/phosphopantothenate--cysteine ligase
LASNHSQFKTKKILVTCGPTWAPIDDMRVISNKSTGQLGHLMAEDLAKAGAEVTLLEGPVVNPIKSKTVKVLKFTYYYEYLKLLREELHYAYDAILHAAAVTDYRLKKTFRKKLSSKYKRLHLELRPTPKVIQIIKKTRPKIFLVGFKLDTTMNQKIAQKGCGDLFRKAKCDLVVANTVQNGRYIGYVLNNQRKILSKANSREEMSKTLTKLIKENL